MKTTTNPPRALVFACIATLVGCHAQPGLVGGGRPLMTDPAPAERGAPDAPIVAGAADGPLVSGAALNETILVDVDPLHGAAFERPTRGLAAVSVAKKLKLLVEFPQVSHDLATGRTSVTMQLTNAGDSLNYLACRVGGERKVISPAYQWNTTVSKTGQTQTQTLLFENPSAGGFTIELSFTGYMAAQAALNTGAATASPPPSAAPTATPGPSATPTALPSGTPTPTSSVTPSASPTPTPSPSGTPTPAPSVSPTPLPTPSASPTTAPGVWTATASSSYGGVPPSRAIDGDPATQWANDGYQVPTAWLAIDTGAVRPIGTLGIKMKPQSTGATYRIETSDDGVSWTAVASGLKNTTWSLEPKALPAGTSARHVRVVFVNDAAGKEIRFSVYEIQLDGAGGVLPPPAPTPTPAPSTSPPIATASLVRDFEADPLNSDPSDFIDANDDGWSYGWMPRITWKVVDRDGSRQYLHDGLASAATLSFRRYNGSAMGIPGGGMPDRYFAEVDVTPIQSNAYAPTGDQGTQFYYLSPTRYVETLIKPQYYEVWSAIGAEPFQSTGWTRLWFMDATTTAGQRRKVGAEIDAAAGTIKVYLDGVLQTTVSSTLITSQAHWFALRGAGNVVTHDNLRIEPR